MEETAEETLEDILTTAAMHNVDIAWIAILAIAVIGIVLIISSVDRIISDASGTHRAKTKISTAMPIVSSFLWIAASVGGEIFAFIWVSSGNVSAAMPATLVWMVAMGLVGVSGAWRMFDHTRTVSPVDSPDSFFGGPSDNDRLTSIYNDEFDGVDAPCFVDIDASSWNAKQNANDPYQHYGAALYTPEDDFLVPNDDNDFNIVPPAHEHVLSNDFEIDELDIDAAIDVTEQPEPELEPEHSNKTESNQNDNIGDVELMEELLSEDVSIKSAPISSEQPKSTAVHASVPDTDDDTVGDDDAADIIIITGNSDTPAGETQANPGTSDRDRQTVNISETDANDYSDAGTIAVETNGTGIVHSTDNNRDASENNVDGNIDAGWNNSESDTSSGDGAYTENEPDAGEPDKKHNSGKLRTVFDRISSPRFAAFNFTSPTHSAARTRNNNNIYMYVERTHDTSDAVNTRSGATGTASRGNNKQRSGRGRDIADKISSIVSTTLFQIILAIVAVLGTAFVGMLALEIAYNPAFTSIPPDDMAYEYTVILAATLGIYLLLQRRGAALVLVILACSLLGIAESFVEAFKYSAILPGELAGAATAADVADGYQYVLNTGMVVSLTLAALASSVLTRLSDPIGRVIEASKGNRNGLSRRFTVSLIYAIVSGILGVVVLSSSYAALIADDEAVEDLGIEVDYWASQCTYHDHGFVPSFITALKDLELAEPDGYTDEGAEDLVSSMADAYDKKTAADTTMMTARAQFNELQPNIVVVMDETFADLATIDGLGVGYTGPPFYNQWSDGVLGKGLLAVSAYGGGTCNTEFEFLTGIPLATLGTGASPYTMYRLDGIDSLPRQMSELGYTTTAIHTEPATNWNRSVAYPALGFDEFIDGEAFADTDPATMVRGHVSDRTTFDMVLDKLRNDGSIGGSFIWDLTMANHSPYDTGSIDTSAPGVGDLQLENVVDPSAAEQTREYLASVAVSDSDLGYLVSKLSELNEPTVLIYFGDHQPSFSWWYTNVLSDAPDGLDAQEQRQQTVYGIWANYRIEGDDGIYGEADGNHMGTSQLAAGALERIGAPLTDRQKATIVARGTLRSLNAYGWMDNAGVWHDISEMPTVSWSDAWFDTHVPENLVAANGEGSDADASAVAGANAVVPDDAGNADSADEYDTGHDDAGTGYTDSIDAYQGAASIDDAYASAEGGVDVNDMDALMALKWITYRLLGN